MEDKNKSKAKAEPVNKVSPDYVTRFKELSKEGKNAREIGELCGVSDTCVRKYLRDGNPPRKYNRSVLSCATGKQYVSSESSKLTALKEEVKTLKEQIKTNEKKYKKTDDELTKAKSDIRDLTKKYKEETIKSNAYETEALNAIEEKTKLTTTLQKIKIEGHETKSLTKIIINRQFHEMENKRFILKNLDHPDLIYPWSKFYMIK